MAIDGKKARARLEALKQELSQLSEISAGERAAVTLDQQSVGRLSRMDAMQRQAMARAQERRRISQLHRIDQALKLLDGGEYGYCQSCGEEIAARRMEIDPVAVYCVKCKGGNNA
ncbi:MAG TPA: TraR/DksA family transcriptional regulator [Rhizobiales bacterium]|nr:TraR/DksA family transcriptional regulator [Hyphomicrobiales bacterium]